MVRLCLAFNWLTSLPFPTAPEEEAIRPLVVGALSLRELRDGIHFALCAVNSFPG